MAELERTYIVPLRKAVNKSPDYKRAKKAVNVLRDFIGKHMKSDDVRIGEKANLEIRKHGIKNSTGKIKVTAVKDKDDAVRAELFGHKYVEKDREVKEEKSKLEQLKEKIAGQDKTKEESHKAIEGAPTEEVKEVAKKKEDVVAEEKNRKTAVNTEKAEHKEKN